MDDIQNKIETQEPNAEIWPRPYRPVQNLKSKSCDNTHMDIPGLIYCSTCGHRLGASAFGRLGGELNPSCLVCRRFIRNASYHRRKLGPKAAPTRSPFYYQVVGAIDRASKLDLHAGVQFSLTPRAGGELGTVTIWQPQYQTDGIDYAPILLLVHLKGRAYLLNLEHHVRTPAAFLFKLNVSFDKTVQPGLQLQAPPIIADHTEIINAKGEPCSLDMMEWQFTDFGWSLEMISNAIKLPLAVVAFLHKSRDWDVVRSAHIEKRQVNNRQKIIEQNEIRNRWIEAKRKEMGLPTTPDMSWDESVAAIERGENIYENIETETKKETKL